MRAGFKFSALVFWMTEAMGQRVYLSQVANNLAAELTGAFSWTITTYTPADLTLLLSMNDSMFYGSLAASPGYFFQADNPSPATPGYTVTFFKNKQLIGADAADTIGRLFTWERNLTHFFYENVDPSQNVFPYLLGSQRAADPRRHGHPRHHLHGTGRSAVRPLHGRLFRHAGFHEVGAAGGEHSSPATLRLVRPRHATVSDGGHGADAR